MASALLANRSNESNWTRPQPRGPKFMGKIPFSNPNPNPNPKFPKKRQFQTAQAPAQAPLNFEASDDASSINRRQSEFSTGAYVTFNIGSYSKKELLELKNRFVSELEQIRQLKNRIDSTDPSQFRSNKKQTKKGGGAGVLGNKRPFPPAVSTNFPKRSNLYGNNFGENAQLMKKCGQILTKLMKHKMGFIFNSPVEVDMLGLHDYYDIIKTPMDLGTVKKKLSSNQYDSPIEFAADVRLTFNNAMKYNPKGHDVHNYAEQFLSKFEEMFRPIRDKVGDIYLVEDHHQDHDLDQDQVVQGHDPDNDIEIEHDQVQEVQASSWDHHQQHNLNRGGSSGVDVERIRKDVENATPVMSKSEHSAGKPLPQSNPPSAPQLPVRTPSPMRAPPVKPQKLPKPKAKEQNKREMTLEEKHKLGLGLQILPQEKMEQVVAIIKKRNGHLRQDGDEIELDIEAVDTETLWELDRFVTNYKKLASKIKRQALMGIPPPGASITEGIKDVSGNERVEVPMEVKKPKKGDAGDEDVDIGDEMPMSNFPPVEIEKDNGHASSSSSSSSSSSDESSSSSDSDSGSSSGSDSEDAHS